MILKGHEKFMQLEGNIYPLSFEQVKRRIKRVLFGKTVHLQIFEENGFVVVHPSETPAGDVVREGKPSFVEDRWIQTWEVRDFNQQELEQQRKTRATQQLSVVDALFRTAITKGYEVTIHGEPYLFSFRDQDRLELSYILQASKGTSQELPVKAMNGKVVLLDSEAIQNLFTTLMLRYLGDQKKVQEMKELIQQASNPEAIEIPQIL